MSDTGWIEEIRGPVEREMEADFTEVIPGRLFQSGRPVPREIVEHRDVNAIVSVSTGEQPWIKNWMEGGGESLKPGRPQQRLRVQVPLIDASNWLDVAAADAVVEMVYHLLSGDDTRRVLVHCDAGAFRSVHIAALVFSRMHALPPRYAFAEIDEQRGHKPPRDTTGLPGWVEHLDSYNLDERWPTADPEPTDE